MATATIPEPAPNCVNYLFLALNRCLSYTLIREAQRLDHLEADMKRCSFCDIEFDDVVVQCVHCGRWLDLTASGQRMYSSVTKGIPEESPQDSTGDMCDEGGICTDDD